MIAACDDGCTGMLLNDLDSMSLRLSVGAGHLAGGFIPPPWTPLNAVDHSAGRLEDMLRGWYAHRETTNTRLNAVADDDIKKKAKHLMNKVRNIQFFIWNYKSLLKLVFKILFLSILTLNVYCN